MRSLYFIFILWIIISCDPAITIEKKIVPPEFPDNEFLISDYGAIGDSITDNIEIINSVIKKCYEAGGGQVVVPKGIYLLNGPIHLKSNINFHLRKGAKLKFSSNPKHYLPVVLTSWEGTVIYNYSPFIYCFKQKNIAITGQGIIDGESSDTWQKWRKIQKKDQLLSREMNHKNIPVEKRVFGEGHFLRPHLIQFFNCENILLDSIRIEDSPFWCVHFLRSKNITARNMEFDAQNRNNDGFDPESSEYVLIENIKFNNNDDNVAIKSGRDHEGRVNNIPSKNIIIRNCSLKGLHGIVIGSEMSGGVENVYVRDCDFAGSLKRGLYLKSNSDRGGYIKNIFFENIILDEVEDCFFITSNYKNEGAGFPSQISNIYLKNITCMNASNYGILIMGSKEKKVDRIVMKNIEIVKAQNDVFIENTERIVARNITINGNEISLE